jgi:hypothetical protein
VVTGAERALAKVAQWPSHSHHHHEVGARHHGLRPEICHTTGALPQILWHSWQFIKLWSFLQLTGIAGVERMKLQYGAAQIQRDTGAHIREVTSLHRAARR